MNNFWPNNFQPQQQDGGNFPSRPFHPRHGFPPDQYHRNMCPPNTGFNHQNPQMCPPNTGFDHQNYQMRPPNTGFNPQNSQMCPPNTGFNHQNSQMRPPNAGFNHQNSQMRPPNTGFNPQNPQMRPPNTGFNPQNPQMCPQNMGFNPRPPFHPQMRPLCGVTDVGGMPNRYCHPRHPAVGDCDVITAEKIVEDFLERKSKLSGDRESVDEKGEEKTKKGNAFLKIHEAQAILREAKILVAKLKNSQQSDDDNSDEIVKNDRLRLQHFTQLLEDEEIREDVKKKVEKRKKRRDRIKRRKKQNAQDRKVEMEKWQAEHQRIDEWQANEKAQLDEQRAEEKRQEEIEESLAEIKKEKGKISKCMAFVNTLAKLRKARYRASVNEDKHVPEEATRCFEERAEQIGKMLTSRGKICSLKEEQVTKLMKNKQVERAECLSAEAKNKQMKWEQQRKQVLFGQDKEEFDELRPIAQLHKQAETNIRSFLIFRQHWDMHVVNHQQQRGSTIPIDWVEPVAPSSDEWSKYLLPPLTDDGGE